jgi:hypothetical protein
MQSWKLRPEEIHRENDNAVIKMGVALFVRDLRLHR